MAAGQNSELKKLSDETLLTMYALRPNAVLTELFERYHVLSFGLCLKYLGDRDRAKDAVSEIFYRLRKDLDRHEIQSFRSWFYVYSKNHCLGILRKAKTRKKHEETWETERKENSDPAHLPEERLTELRRALGDLKKDQRECISLFYYQKHSYSEIARMLSISEKKVKSHLQNGKRNLRLMLNSSSPNARKNA